jgi:hypothetical protein
VPGIHLAYIRLMSEKQRQKKDGRDKNKKNQAKRAREGPQSRDEHTEARKRMIGRGKA